MSCRAESYAMTYVKSRTAEAEGEGLRGSALALDELEKMLAKAHDELPPCKWGVRRFAALPGPGGAIHLTAKVNGGGATVSAEMILQRNAERADCALVWYRLALATMRRPGASKVE